MVILPKKKESLERLEKKIATTNFLDLFANVKEQEITLHLPKFQIEVTASLNDPLERVWIYIICVIVAFIKNCFPCAQMGFGSMFTDGADFSGLTSSKLKVSKVLQKTYFEINENGTEAAAVTG